MISASNYYGYTTSKGEFVSMKREDVENFFEEQQKLEKMILEETDVKKKANLEAQRKVYSHRVNIRTSEHVVKMSAQQFRRQIQNIAPDLAIAGWNTTEILDVLVGAELEIKDTTFEKGDAIPADWGASEGAVFSEDYTYSEITEVKSDVFFTELADDVAAIRAKKRAERRARLGIEPKQDA